MAAGIGFGILTVPLVASISEDALRSVPQSLREASYGMGAKRVTTVVRVVIPAAVSGLVAAFIVALSRPIGGAREEFIAAGPHGATTCHPPRAAFRHKWAERQAYEVTGPAPGDGGDPIIV